MYKGDFSGGSAGRRSISCTIHMNYFGFENGLSDPSWKQIQRRGMSNCCLRYWENPLLLHTRRFRASAACDRVPGELPGWLPHFRKLRYQPCSPIAPINVCLKLLPASACRIVELLNWWDGARQRSLEV